MSLANKYGIKDPNLKKVLDELEALARQNTGGAAVNLGSRGIESTEINLLKDGQIAVDGANSRIVCRVNGQLKSVQVS